jgi:hypothetical protein
MGIVTRSHSLSKGGGGARGPIRPCLHFKGASSSKDVGIYFAKNLKLFKQKFEEKT